MRHPGKVQSSPDRWQAKSLRLPHCSAEVSRSQTDSSPSPRGKDSQDLALPESHLAVADQGYRPHQGQKEDGAMAYSRCQGHPTALAHDLCR